MHAKIQSVPTMQKNPSMRLFAATATHLVCRIPPARAAAPITIRRLLLRKLKKSEESVILPLVKISHLDLRQSSRG